MLSFDTTVNYAATRYTFLKYVETVNGTIQLVPYLDSKNIPTIDIGVNLRVDSNLTAVLKEITGLTSISTSMFNAFDNIVSQAYSSSTDLRTALNNEMVSWQSIYTTIPSTFSFPSTANVENVFNTLIPTYETAVDNWLALIPESYERVALTSLAWNNANLLLGTSLSSAIVFDNRAEAWFEIRYNSNGDQLPGIAKRRFYESEMFGLYKDQAHVTEKEALDAFKMFGRHEQKIISYNSSYEGNGITNANNDYDTSILRTGEVQNFEDSLEPARDYLVDHFGYGVAIDNIWVDYTPLAGGPIYGNNVQETDKYDGTAGNDLIFTGNGNDVIRGGTGDDVIVINGTGNKVVYGGAGADIFVWDPRIAGTVTIMDASEEDTIQLVDGTIGDLDGIWVGNDGQLLDTDGDRPGSIILPDFEDQEGNDGPMIKDPTGPGQDPARDKFPTDQDPDEPGHGGNPSQWSPWGLGGVISDNGGTPAPLASPLIIDMDNDGVELGTPTSGNVPWKIDDSGMLFHTAWVGADDALVVIDKNGNGKIDDHSELFGDLVTNGFIFLAEYDSNNDAVIDSNDTQFSEIQLWNDLNQDGISQSGELQTLSDGGVQSISLSSIPTGYYEINGNPITDTSTVTMTDTSTRTIVDAWFRYDPVHSEYGGDWVMNPSVIGLPKLRGFGEIKDLDIAMSENSTLLNQVKEIKEANLETLLSADFNVATKFRDLLMSWDNIKLADGYSNYYGDSKKVQFVADLIGLIDIQMGFVSMNQYEHRTGTFQLADNWLQADFLAQTELGGIFSGAPAYDPDAGIITGVTGLSSAGLADVITAISSSSNPEYSWSVVVRLVDSIIGLSNLTSSDYNALDTAIQNDTTHTLSSLSAVMTRDFEDHIIGTSGNDVLNGTISDDAITSDAGSDTLNGGFGDDRLVSTYDNFDEVTFNGGVGNDAAMDQSGQNSIYIYESGHDQIIDLGGTDTIQMASGITLSDLKIYYNTSVTGIEANLIIEVNGRGSIVIEGQNNWYGAIAGIETIAFSNSTTLNLTNLIDPITGTSSADILTGLDHSYYLTDVLVGNDGNDLLNGGLGDDYLEGGNGNDEYTIGQGFDVIKDFSGSADKAVFVDGYLKENITLKIEYDTYGFANNLAIYYKDALAARVVGQFSSGGIEEIVAGDGTINLLTYEFEQHGTPMSNTLYGLNSGASENDRLFGHEGSDAINGYNGNDYIDGGSGNDNIDGDGGNDTLNGGRGDDIVTADSGNDTLVYVYNDNINREDFYYGGYDSDTLELRFTNDISESIVDDIASYYSYITNPSNIDTSASSGAEYTFADFDLTASRMEDVRVFLDGWELDISMFATAIHGTNGNNGSINGTLGNDLIFGHGGYDAMAGDDGNDILIGGLADDEMYGGDGDDVLIGGYGPDFMMGGQGADTYVFHGSATYDELEVVIEYNAADDDVLYLSDLLINYIPGQSNINDYLSFTTEWNGLALSIDRDGLGDAYGSTDKIYGLGPTTGFETIDALFNNGNIVVA